MSSSQNKEPHWKDIPLLPREDGRSICYKRFVTKAFATLPSKTAAHIFAGSPATVPWRMCVSPKGARKGEEKRKDRLREMDGRAPTDVFFFFFF
jgi:hypothetical protein